MLVGLEDVARCAAADVRAARVATPLPARPVFAFVDVLALVEVFRAHPVAFLAGALVPDRLVDAVMGARRYLR